MAAWSNFAENKLIDWFFRAQAIGITGATAAAGTGPANLYIGLHNGTALGATPDAGTFTEVSGANYGRATVVSSLANWAGTQGAGTTVASSGTGGTTSNNNAITFATPSATWGTVTGVGVFDAVTGGNLLFYSDLTASKTINASDSVSFPAGSLTFQIDN